MLTNVSFQEKLFLNNFYYIVSLKLIDNQLIKQDLSLLCAFCVQRGLELGFEGVKSFREEASVEMKKDIFNRREEVLWEQMNLSFWVAWPWWIGIDLIRGIQTYRILSSIWTELNWYGEKMTRRKILRKEGYCGYITKEWYQEKFRRL